MSVMYEASGTAVEYMAQITKCVLARDLVSHDAAASLISLDVCGSQELQIPHSCFPENMKKMHYRAFGVFIDCGGSKFNQLVHLKRLVI